MSFLLKCRRTFVAMFAISCLTFLAYSKGIDVAMAIAAIAGVLSGANAFEGSKNGKQA